MEMGQSITMLLIIKLQVEPHRSSASVGVQKSKSTISDFYLGFCDRPNYVCNFDRGNDIERGAFRFTRDKWTSVEQRIKSGFRIILKMRTDIRIRGYNEINPEKAQYARKTGRITLPFH